MLDIRRKRYVLCTEDGGIVAAYSDLEDARIDYMDLKDNLDIKLFEVIHTYPFEEGRIINIMRSIEVEEEGKDAEEVEETKEGDEKEEGQGEGEGENEGTTSHEQRDNGEGAREVKEETENAKEKPEET